MANVKVSLEGTAAMRRKLLRGILETPKEIRRAALEVAARKLEIVKSRTPVKKGRILRSERVRIMVSPKREDLRVSILAGGPEAPHARVVHEIHKTKSKFLESVIMEAVPTIGAEIAGVLELKKMVPPV